MKEIILDRYVGNRWGFEGDTTDFSSVFNNVGRRSLKLSTRGKNRLNRLLDRFSDNEDLTSEEKIIHSRVRSCCKSYVEYDKIRGVRNDGNIIAAGSREKLYNRYNHKPYQYDTFNEFVRFGMCDNSGNYQVIISFEDSLDFIFSCLFTTEPGSIIKFCKDNGYNYHEYSRQLIGGGCCKKLYLNDLIGCSQTFDIIINSLESDDSLEKRLFYSELYKFCMDFRNALMVTVGADFFNTGSVLMSAGISSLIYSCGFKSDVDVIRVRYKTYETDLKVLCYVDGDYSENLVDRFCVI